MAKIRLFGPARDAAGRSIDEIEGAELATVLDHARDRYGAGFAEVLASSAVWVNGEPASDALPIGRDDEVAVLPPVSGG